MSHSRIYQYSNKPIEKEDYLTDSDFCDNNYLWHVFEGLFHGDYTNQHSGKERIDDIEWLSEHLKKFKISWDGKDKFTLEEGSHQAIRDFWYTRIYKAYNEINKDTIENFSDRYLLKNALLDPLSMGFGFLFSHEGDLTASNDFFEWILYNVKEGDSFYIGATLDYHC